MTTPTTALDQRFSAPDAVATSWEETLRVIRAADLFWISTVRADGRPHVTPLPAVWLDGALHFCTGEAEQKAVNLRGNPHVTLMTGGTTWDRGLDVVVEGDAVGVTDRSTLESLAELWARQWDGRWQWRVGDDCFHDDHGDGKILVFSVQPAKVLVFAKGVFGQTAHRF